MSSLVKTVTLETADADNTASNPRNDSKNLKSPPNHEQIPDPNPGINNWVSRLQNSFLGCCGDNSKWYLRIVLVILFLMYTAYFTYAMIHSSQGSTVLISLTCIVVFAIAYNKISNNYGDQISEKCSPVGKFLNERWPTLQW